MEILFLRICAVVTVAILASHGAVGSDAITDLQPQTSFSISKILNDPAWTNLIVREMRTTPDAVWFLISSNDGRPETVCPRVQHSWRRTQDCRGSFGRWR